jgi:hypothetical protein
MGRRKIDIRPIQANRRRANTYKKRKPGLMKKAYELGELCRKDVYVFIIDRDTGATHTFASTDEEYVPDYKIIKPGDRKGPKDFEGLYGVKRSVRKIATRPQSEVKVKVEPQVAKESRPALNDGASSSLVGAPRSSIHKLHELSKQVVCMMASIAGDGNRGLDAMKAMIESK